MTESRPRRGTRPSSSLVDITTGSGGRSAHPCTIGSRRCAKRAHRKSASDDLRRVHFQSPEYLVERLDAIAEIFDKDRPDLLVEAIREYIEDTADSEPFQELVARKYYNDQIEFQTVKQLVGAETAQRLRLLKADLEGEPLDLDAPDDAKVYDVDAPSVETTADDDR